MTASTQTTGGFEIEQHPLLFFKSIVQNLIPVDALQAIGNFSHFRFKNFKFYLDAFAEIESNDRK